MIGLVAASHSTKAAEGIAEVAAQMGGGNARIVLAGGDEDGIGALPGRIREGIEEADDGDGVVVLVDLGSAVMNAELAIETVVDSEAVIADTPVLEETLDAIVEMTSKKIAPDSVVERAEDVRDYRKLNWSALNRPG